MNNLENIQQRIDGVILRYLPYQDPDYPELRDALQYAILNSGKRLRPALLYSTGQMLGAPLEVLDPVACAVEMVHCFSLIHDDLPAMDNSDFRRGKPSCHCRFGEDVAILAGDNLLTLAMEILSNTENAPLSAHLRLQLIHLLCTATGAAGMVGGQMMDIKNIAPASEQRLKKLHRLKTGALIKASVLMGALCSPAPLTVTTHSALQDFAETLGLLYQVCDDILDVTAEEALLGKPRGTDEKLGKITYVSLLGLTASKEYVAQLHHQALVSLSALPHSAHLKTLTDAIAERVN